MNYCPVYQYVTETVVSMATPTVTEVATQIVTATPAPTAPIHATPTSTHHQDVMTLYNKSFYASTVLLLLILCTTKLGGRSRTLLVVFTMIDIVLAYIGCAFLCAIFGPDITSWAGIGITAGACGGFCVLCFFYVIWVIGHQGFWPNLDYVQYALIKFRTSRTIQGQPDRSPLGRFGCYNVLNNDSFELVLVDPSQAIPTAGDNQATPFFIWDYVLGKGALYGSLEGFNKVHSRHTFAVHPFGVHTNQAAARREEANPHPRQGDTETPSSGSKHAQGRNQHQRISATLPFAGGENTAGHASGYKNDE